MLYLFPTGFVTLICSSVIIKNNDAIVLGLWATHLTFFYLSFSMC